MYTSEEVQEKINQFLLTQVSVTTTRQGARDILSMRDEIFDMLTTAILLRPDSFFYIVSRTVNRFEALRRKQAVSAAAILTALGGVTRRGLPIESTAELSNAQAALLEINAGLNSRTSGSGIRGSIGPGVERFQRATERFIRSELVKNIVSGSDIVETADELRSTISTEWAAIVDRHEKMVELGDAIVAAISRLDSVRLPEQTVQGIVGRINTRLSEVIDELGGDNALALSRNNALDLFVMRVLLARASSFRAPSLVLAPLTGDSITMTLTTGTLPGEVLGNVSGPFNYTTTDNALDLETGSGGVLPTFAVPGDSRATIQSAAAASFDFGAGFDVAIQVGGGPIASTSLSGVQAVAAVASAIDIALGANGTATVESSRVVVRAAVFPDFSLLEVLQDTASRQVGAAILAWDKTYAAATPTEAQTIADALLADPTYSPHVDPEVLFTDYGSYTGFITATLGEEARLQVTGVDFTAIPVGARVRVTNGDRGNVGYYRVVSGSVGYLTVDRSLPVRPDTSVGFNVFTSFLKLKATGAGPTDGIRVTTAGDVPTALGFSIDAALNKGFATTGTIGLGDLLERGVRAGDLLLLDTDTPETARTISVVGRQQVSFSPGFPYGAGATTAVAYSIRSYRYQQYRFLIDGTSAREGIAAWLETWRTITELDRRAGQVIRGGRPGQLGPLLQAFLDSNAVGVTYPPVPSAVPDITTLQDDTEAYVVPFENTINNILRLLSEQGMDRALELLLTLDIETFFTMPAEGASYSTWLNRKAADAARVVAPVSKLAVSDTAAQEVRLLASQPDPFNPDAGDLADFLQSDGF